MKADLALLVLLSVVIVMVAVAFGGGPRKTQKAAAVATYCGKPACPCGCLSTGHCTCLETMPACRDCDDVCCPAKCN